MADILLAMALYSHFRSEQKRWSDITATSPARPGEVCHNEGFRFFSRVLQCFSPSAMNRRCWRARHHSDGSATGFGATSGSRVSLALH
jgi:alkane 1-monooxygenase